MNFESLGPPNFHVFSGSDAEFGQFTFGINYSHSPEWAVRVVRGHKMRRLDDLFDEFAAAFQFPHYFGENWPAFYECMTDLEWLPAQVYLLGISNATTLLLEESPDRSTFIRIIGDVCKYWRDEHKLSTRFVQVPVPFHVVFHATQSEIEFLQAMLGDCAADILKTGDRKL